MDKKKRILIIGLIIAITVMTVAMLVSTKRNREATRDEINIEVIPFPDIRGNNDI